MRALSLSTSSKSALNLLSQSWIRNRICANRSVMLQRRRMLECSVTDDAVLAGPAGCWEGVPGLAERIGR